MSPRLRWSPPALSPPDLTPGVGGWLRSNLCNTWYNAVITLLFLSGLVWLVWHAGHWVLTQAHWRAVTVNLRLFAVGLYPGEALWRPIASLVFIAWLSGGSAAQRSGLSALASQRLLVGLLLLTVVLPGQGRLAAGSAAATRTSRRRPRRPDSR